MIYIKDIYYFGVITINSDKILMTPIYGVISILSLK